MLLPIYVPIIASLVSFVLTFLYCKNNMNVNDLQMDNARSKLGGVQGLTVLLLILIFGSGLSFMTANGRASSGVVGGVMFLIGLLNSLIAYASVLIASRKLKGYDIKQIEEKYFMRNVNYSLGSVLNVIAMIGGCFLLIIVAGILANTKGITSNELVRIIMGLTSIVLPFYLMVAIPKWLRKSVIRRYKKRKRKFKWKKIKQSFYHSEVLLY